MKQNQKESLSTLVKNSVETNDVIDEKLNIEIIKQELLKTKK
jgi:hypothetical protein